MCKKVCNKLDDDEKPPANEVPVEVISEERASRCMQRVEMLNKVRHDVLRHEKFEEWIKNCLPSSDLPDWWIPQKQDEELVKAAARYGVIRTEFYYVNDVEFTFKDCLNKYMKHIEMLMDEDNANLAQSESATLNTDPIQYYFQNQAKIQFTFRELMNKENNKQDVEKVKEVKKENHDHTANDEEKPSDQKQASPVSEKTKDESKEEKEKNEEGQNEPEIEKTEIQTEAQECPSEETSMVIDESITAPADQIKNETEEEVAAKQEDEEQNKENVEKELKEEQQEQEMETDKDV